MALYDLLGEFGESLMTMREELRFELNTKFDMLSTEVAAVAEMAQASAVALPVVQGDVSMLMEAVEVDTAALRTEQAKAHEQACAETATLRQECAQSEERARAALAAHAQECALVVEQGQRLCVESRVGNSLRS